MNGFQFIIRTYWPLVTIAMSIIVILFSFFWIANKIFVGAAISSIDIIIIFFASLLLVSLNIILVISMNWLSVRRTGALVPEEWSKNLETVSMQIENHVRDSAKYSENNYQIGTYILNEVQKTSEIIEGYTKLIDDKDKKITELEIGSNIVLKASVMERFISLTTKLQRMTSDIPPKNVTVLIMDILAEEGVQQMDIRVGRHIDDYPGQLDLASSTSDGNAVDGEITAIVSHGYFMQGPTRPYILKKAVVNYHHTKGRGEE